MLYTTTFMDYWFYGSDRNRKGQANFYDPLLTVLTCLLVCLGTFHIFDFFTWTIEPNLTKQSDGKGILYC